MKPIQVASLIAAFGTAAVSASPLASEIQARAPITSADFSSFAVTCSSSECSISTNIVLQPEGYAVSCTHTIPGSTLPSTGGIWTCSDTLVWPRYNRGPFENAPYRIVLTDGRDPTNAATVRYDSPRSDWPGDAGYSGPTSFTAV
ncbi:hypothetical protein B0T14DRAFT_572184 [Immersiella caudata]|uniref:Uncharacterized protein n=1 Tax=Immersiella caudata TaxID=314043 RepID=A0AA39U216_9PEZI|nr:hypothetical protein B0T14DRAFT_572184 [Immersiella caudata]